MHAQSTNAALLSLFHRVVYQDGFYGAEIYVSKAVCFFCAAQMKQK